MLSDAQMQPLLQSVLVSRFQMKFRRMTKTMPVFVLVVAKRGPKVQPNAGASHQTDWGKDHINARDVTMAEFGKVLETQLDRVVIDETKFSGTFDFRMTWTPGFQQEADLSGPSLFTAIEEQYGLRLKPGRGSVEVIVIDRLEHPSGN